MPSERAFDLWVLFLTGEMDHRWCGDVLVPEALAVLAFYVRRDQVRLDLPGAESHGSECLLVRRPGYPVDVELHPLLCEEKCDADSRPLVEGLVHKALHEPVFPMIEYRLRRPVWIGVTRYKVLARFEIVVDRLHHVEQLFPALGIVQEARSSDAIKLADFSQHRGVCNTILDAQGLRVFLLLGEPDHLRRDVDTHHAAGPPLLEATTTHPVATGQVKDGETRKVAQPEAERVPLGLPERHGVGDLLIIEGNVIVLCHVSDFQCGCEGIASKASIMVGLYCCMLGSPLHLTVNILPNAWRYITFLFSIPRQLKPSQYRRVAEIL
jgi:hypothetical protein